MDNVTDIVYVKRQNFSSLNNPAVAREIEALNKAYTEAEKGYILIGPGRWGSSDPALGIPVKWANISSARVIAETALPGYRIEPSQGTHFFQNLTSFGVGYFTIDNQRGDLCDYDYLDSLPAVKESDYLRVVQFKKPLQVGVNGKTGLGIIVKPND